MSETTGPRLTVADLGDEHRGWEVKVFAEWGDVPRMPSRTFMLGGNRYHRSVRQWKRPDGTAMVGLLDGDACGPGYVGTERIYPADTPVELVRAVKGRTKRASARQAKG